MARKKNFIFTNKRHSEKAIMSTLLGIISTASLAAVLYLTYLQKGEAPVSYGLTGLLIILFSLIGLILGIMTAIEKDMYKLFPGLGILFNGIALCGMALIVYAGVYM